MRKTAPKIDLNEEIYHKHASQNTLKYPDLSVLILLSTYCKPVQIICMFLFLINLSLS